MATAHSNIPSPQIPGTDDEQKAVLAKKYRQFHEQAGIDSQGNISPSALQHVLLGVNIKDDTAMSDVAFGTLLGVNTAPTKNLGDEIREWISAHKTPLTLRAWITAIESELRNDAYDDKEQLAKMLLAVAFMRGKSRLGADVQVNASDLDLVWILVHRALTSKKTKKPLWEAKRSAQGFMSIALSTMVDSSLKPAQILEMFRLHVWLPDGQRGNRDVEIHSHTAFGRSWILAGAGENHTWETEPASISPADAGPGIYASYHNKWDTAATVKTAGGESMEQDIDIKVGYVDPSRQVSSSVVKTSQLFRAWESVPPQHHSRNMSYWIPEAAYHSSVVAGDQVHATLFFFDGFMGSVPNAPILGPVNGRKEYVTYRDPTGLKPAVLADLVEACRALEVLEEGGKASKQELEEAKLRKRGILEEIKKTTEQCGGN